MVELAKQYDRGRVRVDLQPERGTMSTESKYDSRRNARKAIVDDIRRKVLRYDQGNNPIIVQQVFHLFCFRMMSHRSFWISQSNDFPQPGLRPLLQKLHIFCEEIRTQVETFTLILEERDAAYAALLEMSAALVSRPYHSTLSARDLDTYRPIVAI